MKLLRSAGVEKTVACYPAAVPQETQNLVPNGICSPQEAQTTETGALATPFSLTFFQIFQRHLVRLADKFL